MIYQCLNLQKYFNERCVYPAETSLKGYHILEKSYPFGIKEKNGIPFLFGRNQAMNDTIECEGQAIYLKGIYGSRIYVIGYGMFGYFEEPLKIKFTDDSIHTMWVRVLDCNMDCENAKENSFTLEHQIFEQCNDVFTEVLLDSGMHGKLYQSKSREFPSNEISQLILPKNNLLKICAITVQTKKIV